MEAHVTVFVIRLGELVLVTHKGLTHYYCFYEHVVNFFLHCLDV